MRFIFIIFLLLSVNLYSQEAITYDKVYKTDKTMLEGKVLRITESQIEFDPKGEIPFILIPRTDVTVIIYADNTVVNLNAASLPKRTAPPIAVKPTMAVDSIKAPITAKKVENSIPKAQTLAHWETLYSSQRLLKEKIFNYNYSFDDNREKGNYSIPDIVNNKLIYIKERGSFTAEINTNKHSKKRSLFLSKIILDLEFTIGKEVVSYQLTSEDLGWGKKDGFIIEAPLTIGKRAPVPDSERVVETQDYIIRLYLELMIPNKVMINYAISTKNDL